MKTHSATVVPLGKALVEVCDDIKRAVNGARELIAANEARNIDWSAVEKLEFIQEDADGNLSGLPYDRFNLADAMGSIQQFLNMVDGLDVTKGNHLANIEAVATVRVK